MRNTGERLAGSHSINDLPFLPSGTIGLWAVDPRRGNQHLVRQLPADFRNLQRLAFAHTRAVQIVDLRQYRGRRAVALGDHGQRFAPLYRVHDIADAIFGSQRLQRALVGISIVDGHQHAMRSRRVGGPSVVTGIERNQFVVAGAG